MTTDRPDDRAAFDQSGPCAHCDMTSSDCDLSIVGGCCTECRATGGFTHQARVTDDRADKQIEAAVKVLLEHRMQYDNTGGFRGVLGGWNSACTCGWHGVSEEFEYHVAGLLCHLLSERLRRAEAERDHAQERAELAEKDIRSAHFDAARALAERDQLRALVAAVRELADEWRYRPHPEGAESMSDWIYRMHVNSLGAILERVLDTAGGEQS